MAKVNMREINWSIQRMRKVLMVFAKLDRIDREYVLRRLRDQDAPREFAQVSQEKLAP